MTYTDIIQQMDNRNYIGKTNKPIKRVQYTAEITIVTKRTTYHKCAFGDTRLQLMRREQTVIHDVFGREMNRYNRMLKDNERFARMNDGEWLYDEETLAEDEPELIEVVIVETDRDGNKRTF